MQKRVIEDPICHLLHRRMLNVGDPSVFKVCEGFSNGQPPAARDYWGPTYSTALGSFTFLGVPFRMQLFVIEEGVVGS